MQPRRSPRRRRRSDAAPASSANSTSRNSTCSDTSGGSASTSHSLSAVQPARRTPSRTAAPRRSGSAPSNVERRSHSAGRLVPFQDSYSSRRGSSASNPGSTRDFGVARWRGSTRLSVLSSGSNGRGSFLSQAMYRSSGPRASTVAPSVSGASLSGNNRSRSGMESDEDGRGASAASFSSASASASSRTAGLHRSSDTTPSQHPLSRPHPSHRARSSPAKWGLRGADSLRPFTGGLGSHSGSTSAEHNGSHNNSDAAVAVRPATPQTVEAESQQQRDARHPRTHSASASTAAATAPPRRGSPSPSASPSAPHGAPSRSRGDRREFGQSAPPLLSSPRASSVVSPASDKAGLTTSRSSGGDAGLVGGLRRARWRRRSVDRASNTPLATVAAAAATVAAAAAAAVAAQRSSGGPQSRRPVMSWRSRARVCAVASAPTGELFTGGDPSGVIEVWDSRIGRRLCGLSGHQATVLSLLTLPHSSLLLSGSADHTARLWDMRTLQNTTVLEGHRGLITALATLWMPDVGLNLFTGSDDGTVRQWRALTGVCVHVYRGHHGPVNVVVSLRPAKYIATGGSDGLFKVWNAQTLRCLSSVAAVPSPATAAAAAGEAGARDWRRRVELNGAGAEGDDAEFSGSGGGGGTAGGPVSASILSVSGDALERGSGSAVGGGAVWDIAQLDDATQSLATATDDGVVRLWATQWSQHTVLLKEICNPDMLLQGRSGARCLLACGAYLFVGGARGELYVWDTEAIPYVGAEGYGAARPRSSSLPLGAYAARLPVVTAAAAPAAAAAAAAHNTTSNTITGTSSIATTATAGGGRGVDGVETYRATFLYHTAAVTGLTRQGAQLCSASLDHMMCRWDLRELVPLTSDDSDPRALPQSTGALTGEDGEGRPSGWGQPWSRAGGPASALAGRSAGGGGAVDDAVMGSLTTSPAADAGLDGAGHAVLTPWARLRRDEVLSDHAAGELTEEETATLYTELPLSFVVRRLRAAASTPVNARSVVRAVCAAAFTAFLTLFFSLGLAPVSLHSIDVAATTFAVTANHPLPGFARPHTFRSITNVADLAAWMRLLFDQLHNAQAPVQVELVPDAAAAATDSTAAHTLVGDVAAMPGGVVLLTRMRMRVRQVHNRSCTWNRHLVRPANVTASGGGGDGGPPCYGPLRANTEATSPMCFDFAAPPASAGSDGEGVSSSGATSVRGCVPYMTSGAGIAFTGVAGHYDSAGYTVDLPIDVLNEKAANMEAALATLSQISSVLFDPLRTRLIDVLLYGYHVHSQTLARLHYTLEIPVSGAWLATTDMRSFSRYNPDGNSSAYLIPACVAILLALLLVELGFVVYDAIVAYYVEELLEFFLSGTVLLEVATTVSGLVLVGFSIRWIALSRTHEVTSLVQFAMAALTATTPSVIPGTENPTIPSLSAPPVVRTVLSQLNSVELAFHALSNAASVHCVLFFAEVTVLSSHWFPFLQIMRVVVREIRVPIVVGLVLLVLGVTGTAIAFHCLFGSTHATFGSVSNAFVQLLLYVGGVIPLPYGVGPPLSDDREVTARFLVIIVNYVVRALFYVYVVAIVSERFEAASRTTPSIPARVLLAKWWSDVQQQVALIRQRTSLKPSSAVAAAPATASAAPSKRALSPSYAPDSPVKSAPVTASLESADGAAADPAPVLTSSIGSDTSNGSGKAEAAAAVSAPRAALGMGQHRSVLIEHLWRRLQLLQHDHDHAQPQPQQRQWDVNRRTMTGGAGHGGDTNIISGRDGAVRRGGLPSLRSWSGRGSRRGSASDVGSDELPRHRHSRTASTELASSPNLITVLGSGGLVDAGRGGADGNGGGGGGHAQARGRRESRDSTSVSFAGTFSIAFPAAASPTEDAAGRTGDAATGAAALVEPRVRQTDLLLLVPEPARTPFARSVIRLAWNTLTWMYHYEQQHHRTQNPAEQERRRRLEYGIQRVQERLTPLYAVVRRTQARMTDHEARLRPLARAVAAVSADAR